MQFYVRILCTHNIPSFKGVFNLTYQLYNFFKNWGMQRGKQNYMSFVMGLFYCIFAILAHNEQLFQDFLPENRVDGINK